MKSNQEYKNRALIDLEGRWNKAAIATLIYIAVREGVSYILSGSTGDEDTTGLGIQAVWEMLSIPLSWGITVYFLNLIRQENIDYGRLFDGYKDFKRVFVAGLLTIIAAVVGLLLFIVPGIIILLKLSQTSFIIKDDSEIGAVDAMKESMRMMQGHETELFGLILSFIGWFLLCLLTLGIGFLFFVPYTITTLAHYYEDLKDEKG
jgi:uncharacterized membrane protein